MNKLKLLTPLLLIVSTLFFVANANARITMERQFTSSDGTILTIIIPENPTREEIGNAIDKAREEYKANLASTENLADKREKSIEDKCIAKAGKMNNEFAAKKLYKSCLADEGL